jgi:hypothetical protein
MKGWLAVLIGSAALYVLVMETKAQRGRRIADAAGKVC